MRRLSTLISIKLLPVMTFSIYISLINRVNEIFVGGCLDYCHPGKIWNLFWEKIKFIACIRIPQISNKFEYDIRIRLKFKYVSKSISSNFTPVQKLCLSSHKKSAKVFTLCLQLNFVACRMDLAHLTTLFVVWMIRFIHIY